MKQLNQFINEYIIKKKLDKPIDSEDHYEYFPKTKQELIDNIKELLDNGETDLNCIDTSEITDMSYLFDGYKHINTKENFDVSGWDVSNVTNMSHMFNGCNFDCDLSKWDVSKVTNMNRMFLGCRNFKGVDLSSWNVSKVENMEFMFCDCVNFTGKGLEKWNVSKANTYYMLYNCHNLKNKPSWYKE